ncbi:MAG: glycosyltransferase family 4 protein [Gemmatimonadaceae bacterium]|nr:glycosyltransferase family 4 protein [Gemmatimonadaceae bacterium]
MPNVLMLFPHPTEKLLADVLAGIEPRERMYGLVELRERGWEVATDDSRLEGFAGWVRRHFNWMMNPLSIRTIRKLRNFDILIVKDDFSLSAALAAWVFGKRIVFLDSMFLPPRRFWRRWSACWCIKLADRTIAFSDTQVTEWVNRYDLPRNKFSSSIFSLDIPFYTRREPLRHKGSILLAIGRDLGRDYSTLLSAIRHSGTPLELVTLPYLSSRLDTQGVKIGIHQSLTYEALFDRYDQCLAAVVPLRAGTSYPSGIRAVLEAMVRGTPVIATRTPILEEHFQHGVHLLFAEAEDVGSLREQINSLQSLADGGLAMAQRARQTVISNFGMDQYLSKLESVLSSVLDPAAS